MGRTVVIGCSPQQSHVVPLLAAARSLVAAGHRVVFLTGRRFEGPVRTAGAEFRALDPSADYDDREVELTFPELAGRTGPDAMRRSVRSVFLPHLPVQLADVRAAVAATDADAVLTEPLFLGGIAYAQLAQRVPVVVAGIFPLLLDSRDTAPFGLGIRPLGGPLRRLGPARNAVLGVLVHRLVFGRMEAEGSAAFVAATGRAPGRTLFEAGLAVDAIAQCTVPGFEYPRSDLPSSVRFVGPLRVSGPVLPAPRPAWWGDLDGRVVVHVTQGTVATADFGDLVVPTALGLADRDVLVVAATGGREPAPVEAAVLAAVRRRAPGAALPANLRIAAWLPYEDLLPRCAVVVTNGGYGGVQAALRHGVPLVVAGRTEDKPEVAARVAWSGAGLDLRTARPRPERIARAVESVLAGTRYRAAAARIAAQMADLDGGPGIVRLLEDLWSRP